VCIRLDLRDKDGREGVIRGWLAKADVKGKVHLQKAEEKNRGEKTP